MSPRCSWPAAEPSGLPGHFLAYRSGHGPRSSRPHRRCGGPNRSDVGAALDHKLDQAIVCGWTVRSRCVAADPAKSPQPRPPHRITGRRRRHHPRLGQAGARRTPRRSTANSPRWRTVCARRPRTSPNARADALGALRPAPTGWPAGADHRSAPRPTTTGGARTSSSMCWPSRTRLPPNPIPPCRDRPNLLLSPRTLTLAEALAPSPEPAPTAAPATAVVAGRVSDRHRCWRS